MRRASGKLIIAGQYFQVDAPVINFREPPFWDSTREFCMPTSSDPNPLCKPGGVPYGNLPRPYNKRYSTRPMLRRYGNNPPLDAVKSVIRQFVIHHDGCNSADMCFSVLQNERGLSCHFLIDNDGTIYQTIDLALMAYHAAEWNTSSIGVELCNRGDAKKEPNYYSSGRFGPKRDVKPCRINGSTFLAFDYTEAQYDAMTRLGRALQRLLPNLPAEFPQSSAGVASWDTMPTSASFRFSGYIGHYHLTNQKWDPGPFDFKEFCRKLRGQLSFPIYVKQPDPAQVPLPPPPVPTQSNALKDAVSDLYKANEQHADGGFFPVGPWGEQRLWHGGVHLTAKVDTPVFAPFPGRLVAARMGANSQVGSMNFVLLRHDMTLGTAKVQFYSLYIHLSEEKSARKPADWTMKSEAWKAGKSGDVILLDEPIEAGSIIGHVGNAGPQELSRPQVHVEFFSTYELFTEVKGAPWQVVDGTSGGRFCDAQQINDIIDTDKNGMLERTELSSFYSGGGAAQTHYFVTLHVSEWTSEPSWSEALLVTKDFKQFKPAEVEAMVAEQITPGLWWDARVAAHCKLPTDGVVFHYHPVSFLGWFNQEMLDAADSAGPAANAADAKDIPKGITDDFGDVNGDSMRSSGEVSEDPCNQKITLQDLVQGFDAPECTP